MRRNRYIQAIPTRLTSGGSSAGYGAAGEMKAFESAASETALANAFWEESILTLRLNLRVTPCAPRSNICRCRGWRVDEVGASVGSSWKQIQLQGRGCVFVPIRALSTGLHLRDISRLPGFVKTPSHLHSPSPQLLPTTSFSFLSRATLVLPRLLCVQFDAA